MFLPGSKVIVIRSSIMKGNIGPRVGSLGYVVNSDARHAVWASYSSDVRVVIVECYINYIRYGFEKTFRNECKRSLCLFPAMSHLHMDASLEELSKILRGDKHKTTRASMVRRLLHYQYEDGNIPPYKKGKVPPITVVMPVKSTQSLLHCHDKEFIAWAESLIRSPSLHKMRASNYNVFTTLAISAPNKNKVLNDAASSIEGRAEIIRRFKREAALLYRNKLGKNIPLAIRGNMRDYIRNLNTMIGRYLFCPGVVKNSTTAAELEFLKTSGDLKTVRGLHEKLFDVVRKYEQEALKVSKL